MRIFVVLVLMIAGVATPAGAGGWKVYERLTPAGSWRGLNLPPRLKADEAEGVVRSRCIPPYPRHAMKVVAPDGAETVHLCEPIRTAEREAYCRDFPVRCAPLRPGQVKLW